MKNYEDKEVKTEVGQESANYRYVVDASGCVISYDTFRQNPKAYTGAED